MNKSIASDAVPNLPPVPSPYVCARCGSEAISREAWAQWDADAQQWVIATLFDFAHCHSCGADVAPHGCMP